MSDVMQNRDMIFREFEEFVQDYGVSYTDYGEEVLKATHELLKELLEAQEPRVMTREEAKSVSGYVFVQSRSCSVLDLRLIKDGFVYDSLAVPISVDDLWWEGYNKYWCIWTSVPTDAQSEAVKWE